MQKIFYVTKHFQQDFVGCITCFRHLFHIVIIRASEFIQINIKGVRLELAVDKVIASLTVLFVVAFDDVPDVIKKEVNMYITVCFTVIDNIVAYSSSKRNQWCFSINTKKKSIYYRGLSNTVCCLNTMDTVSEVNSLDFGFIEPKKVFELYSFRLPYAR